MSSLSCVIEEKNLTIGLIMLLHEEEWVPVDVTVEVNIRSTLIVYQYHRNKEFKRLYILNTPVPAIFQHEWISIEELNTGE